MTMTKETYHEKIMKEEKKLDETQIILSNIQETMKKYGAEPNGLAQFNFELHDWAIKKWVLDILKEADPLYVPIPKPPAKAAEKDTGPFE